MIERADIRRERHDLLVSVQCGAHGLDALVAPIAKGLEVGLKGAERELVDALVVLRAAQAVAVGAGRQFCVEQVPNFQHPQRGQHMKVQAALGHHPEFGFGLLRFFALDAQATGVRREGKP